MQIGPLAPGHLDAAVALWHEVGLTRPWNDPAEDLRRAIAGPSSTVLAGTDGDTLTATAMVGHDGHRGGSLPGRAPRRQGERTRPRHDEGL